MTKQSFIGRLFEKLLHVAVYIALRPKVFWEDKAVKRQLGTKPMVIVANHTHHFDGVFVSSVLRKCRPYILVTRKWYDKKRVGKLIRMCRCVSIDLNTADASWYTTCREILEHGNSVIIFPEGALARDGEVLPFHSGAALLSAVTGADILPVAISGEYSLLFGARQRLQVGTQIPCNCPPEMRRSRYAAQQTKLVEAEVRRLCQEVQNKN